MFTSGQRELLREIIREEIREALQSYKTGAPCEHGGSDALSQELGYMVASYLYPLLDLKDRSIRPQGEKPGETFERTEHWRKVRLMALEKYGTKCMKCGSEDNVQVDHIKPKSKHPELALTLDNLQVLCWPCNKEKGASDDNADYRPAV